MSEQPKQPSGAEAGSYVQSDAGVSIPDEERIAPADATYAERRDNEQIGLPRTAKLEQVQEMAPPAANPDAPQAERGGVDAGNTSAER